MKNSTRKTTYRKPALTKAVKTYVNKAIHANIENKYFNTDLASIWGSVATTWIERDVCYPTQGDDIVNKTGRELKIRSIEITGVLCQGSNQTALDDAYNVIRIVIGLYAGLSYQPLFDAGATIDQPITTNFNTKGQLIKKYLDQYICLNSNGVERAEGDGYVPMIKQFNYYKKFKTPVTIRFGDTGTVNQQRRIVFSMISDSGLPVNPGFIHGYMKVMFEDA